MSTAWTVSPRSRRHRPPRPDVRLVVERGHDDLVARLERRADRAADVEGQAGHVLAELDLVGRARVEQVGDRQVAVGHDRHAPLARDERPAVVRVRGPVVVDDRVDDPLRDLRAAGAVEERQRAAVLLEAQRGELAPERGDVERGHRRPPVDRAAIVAQPAAARRALSRSPRTGRRRARPGSPARAPGSPRRRGGPSRVRSRSPTGRDRRR